VPSAIIRPAASAMLAPKLIPDAGEHTSLRFPDFFTAKNVAPVAAVRTHRVSAYGDAQ
jgi:hypothetical protein